MSSFKLSSYIPPKLEPRSFFRTPAAKFLSDITTIPAIASSNEADEEVRYLLHLKNSRNLFPKNEDNSLVFESPLDMMERIPNPVTLASSTASKIPWMIEAPLNTIEIIDAILKPAKPYPIYTAYHVRRGYNQHLNLPTVEKIEESRRLYEYYHRFQGVLEEDREISFILLDPADVCTIREKFHRIFTPIKLFYISLPWIDKKGAKTLTHPWALALDDYPRPGSDHTYDTRMEFLLKTLDISGYTINQKNYLRPGTRPLPECVLDWFMGVPGKDQASPYYHKNEDAAELTEEDKGNEMVPT